MNPLRTIGLILMLSGFLAGAFVSVRKLDIPAAPAPESEVSQANEKEQKPAESGTEQDVATESRWNSVEWKFYIPAMLIGIAGVAILRFTAKRADIHSEKLDGDMNTMRSCLDRLVQKLESLNNDSKTINVYDMHDRLDNELAEDLGAFANARETIIHIHGTQAYADIMTQFAAAERTINRAWSASADGYIDEVQTCLDRAQQFMTTARDNLKEANKNSANHSKT